MRRLACSCLLVLAIGALGCASGGGGGSDAGRRDTPTPGLDAPGRDTPGADVPMVMMPDVPLDAPMTIMRDTGVDAPRPDTPGVDAPPECTTAAECSDGNACNGAERCEFGTCVDGAPPVCDDGVPCTTDACMGSGCSYTPVSARCDDGVACTVDTCTASGCSSVPNDSLCMVGQRCTSTGCTSTGSCSETPCRLVPPQCGCPMGQSCVLNGTSRLCAAPGLRNEGDSCTAATDCASGLACVNFSSSGTAQMCSRMCGGDLDCTGGGLCIIELSDGMGGTLPGVRVCTRACNPVAQTGCAPGLYCSVYRETAGAMRYLTDCSGPPGTGGTGAFCLDDSDCQAGFLCIDVDGFGTTCNHWCNVTTGAGCTGGLLCYGFTTPVIVSGVEYGVCAM